MAHHALSNTYFYPDIATDLRFCTQREKLVEEPFHCWVFLFQKIVPASFLRSRFLWVPLYTIGNMPAYPAVELACQYATGLDLP
jgi:hypothetical protein